MIKTQLLLKRKWLPTCSVLLFCFSSFSAYPNIAYATDPYYNGFNEWLDRGNHPVIAVGTGGYLTTNSGYSQDFPIQDPITDSFYNYSVNRSTQAAAFISFFLGDEWLIADRYWAMQAGLEFSETSALHVDGNLTQGAEVVSENNYTYNYDVRIRQLLIDAKILFTCHQIFHPYIFAGLGPSFNEASDYTTTVPPDLTFTQEYKSRSTTSFSWALGFGVDVDIHDKVRLGLGYRFTNLGQVSLGSASIDGIPVPGTLTQNHLYANELIAQLSLVL
jgi:opacity protein-like surface antigen